MKTAIGSIAFTISAETLVSHARNVCESGEWGKSITCLTEALEGFPVDYAIGVVSGEYTLTGNSEVGINVVEDADSADYKQTLREVYIDNYFYENGEFYKFERVIGSSEINEMRDMHNLNYGPTYDSLKQLESVKQYLTDYRTEKVWQLHSTCYVVGTVQNPNICPMWFKRSEYFQTYLECYNNFYGFEKHQTYTSTSSTENNTPTVRENVCESSWYKSERTNYIQVSAEDNDYHDAQAMSHDLREQILKACKERGVTWIDVETESDTGTITTSVPLELARAYITRDNEIWNPICESGLKMYNDSAFHSDIWLAMGNDIDGEEYNTDNPKTRHFFDLMDQIRFSYHDSGEFDILNDVKLKSFEGRLVYENSENITDRDILVLPNANLKYESLAKKAGMVITESGGPLSHLVMVGREDMFAVIIMKDAINELRYCSHANVDFENKTISTMYGYKY